MVSKLKLDLFYLDICTLVSRLSYCKRKQVGSILVKDNRIISYGFNGAPPGEPNICEDENNKTLPSVIHSEINTLFKLEHLTDAQGATLYCSLEPCVACSVAIVSAGVSEVVFRENYGIGDGIAYMKEKGIKVSVYD